MISIGILSYKRTDLLLDTLKDIVNVNDDVEIIILNNNINECILSEIESVINLSDKINLKYIHDNCNYGVALGRRKIIEHCDNDYIIMLDDDIKIPDINMIITSCLNCFSVDKSLAGIAFNIKEFSTLNHNRYEIPHKNKSIDMTSSFYTYLMIGAGHALDVKSVKEVGNYPADFGLYGFEEVDLSFRLINSGFTIKYLPECEVHHKKSPDGRFSNKIVNKLAFINRCKMAKRYFHYPYFISCLFVRSVFLLCKTKDVKLFFSSIHEVLEDNVSDKFGPNFYRYVKTVKGFIYW